MTKLRENIFGFKPTHVIHSAASYSDPNNWVEDVNTNVIGTINLTAALKYQIDKFIYFQTSLAYGRPEYLIPVNYPTAPFIVMVFRKQQVKSI